MPFTAWDEASAASKDFVSQLTTVEKIGLVTGGYSSPSLPCVGAIGSVERLGFEGVCYSDGPSGYSRSDGVSIFPAGVSTAATWDKDLMFRRAVALGEEFRAKGAHVHLGPSSGPLGRHAVGGRNWESFGPDPYLAGVAMNASVIGIQSVGVQACSKHFIGNEQETQRTSTVSDNGTIIEAISSDIDDRTLHELYLWPFANAVKAGTASIMCSYNRVNGNYSCANPEMISILKDELAFPGYVVSDWYATHETLSSANSGLDLEMPGNVSAAAGASFFGESLLDAINSGLVSADRLGDMATRVLTPYFLLGQDKDFPSVDPSSGAAFLRYQYGHQIALPSSYAEVPARDVRGNHAELIREIGAAGTVLLKNVNGTLPLTEELNIGVFGNDAPYPTIGSVFLDIGTQPEGFVMGTVNIGGGSGTVRHTDLVSPFEAIRKHAESLGGRVQAVFDNDELADGRFRTIYPVPDVCLLFLKSYATEGQDRHSAELQWSATKAVENTAAMCSNTVVIIHGPGVVVIPWADNENVTAILNAHYPGEQTGNAIVDVLWGAVEPSGRLPYSIPKNESDYGPSIVNLTGPATDRDAWHSIFEEGQMIDYRHLDANDIEPQYEFGFGLSYTEFEMGDSLEIHVYTDIAPVADEGNGVGPGGLSDLWEVVASTTIEVTNSGSLAGSAVPQLYVSFPNSTTPEGTPVKVLRGFEKVHLGVGETKSVVFDLMRRDLSFWNIDKKQWTIPSGAFRFMGSFSSKDIRATAEAQVIS
ncbi:glycosyl hydrolase family 3 N terminal domain-containing protein [Colletotrichum godetiae]|uniref:Beta-glucosidase cel3A n=1 Tax=Colletotrichum godetiae TaxID=1209918 RepID=A0AAJ0AUJ0_9PEZI|nr:glycosyl hydrolase family 3 N terminal domain-containing protein [Colletotrichum godetiae]KAK1690053.1 glycosyl hydrolase family 3 N terminal domain-containing protein [Colletotrichum godetiae]